MTDVFESCLIKEVRKCPKCSESMEEDYIFLKKVKNLKLLQNYVM